MIIRRIICRIICHTGEPRTRIPTAPTPDSDSDGTYHHGPGPARTGSDSRTQATRDDPAGFGPGHSIRVSSFPSRPGRPPAGPKHRNDIRIGPRAQPVTTSRNRRPFIGPSSFPQRQPPTAAVFHSVRLTSRASLLAPRKPCRDGSVRT